MEWRSIETIPDDEYVLIHTKTGRIRIAKKVNYLNGDSRICYSSQYFKDVTHWMPLPEPPQILKIIMPKVKQ